jgi:hypothetical protein
LGAVHSWGSDYQIFRLTIKFFASCPSLPLKTL